MKSFVLVLVCVFSFAYLALGSLEVEKKVEPGTTNGVYRVSVGYRSVGHSGRVYGVVIVDSLPRTLDLVSGELVVKVEGVRAFLKPLNQATLTFLLIFFVLHAFFFQKKTSI